MNVVMFRLMMMTKMVSMPMMNSTEDILDTILDCPQVSFCQNLGDHSNFIILWRPALSPKLFALYASLLIKEKRS